MTNELFGLGAVVQGVWWWSTPDKYKPPRRFDDVAAARAYGTASVITVELLLRCVGGAEATLVGEVPSVAPNFRLAEGASDASAPQVGATAVEFVPRNGVREPPRSVEARCDDRYRAIIFRNPDGVLVSVRPWMFPGIFQADEPQPE
ncbi:hypothetical protein [Actinocatenispora sera]|uniref:Uncharacterized protein n=1 Tax=Actinocatenispora sera TaxID=390989 RepID=A0A810L951_9ACTN|nr:hypothetical protein [Actinocatenispora sera]BCJ30851.1 hypothetical protein Asera_49590 [Actinocatenispora sera]